MLARSLSIFTRTLIPISLATAVWIAGAVCIKDDPANILNNRLLTFEVATSSGLYCDCQWGRFCCSLRMTAGVCDNCIVVYFNNHPHMYYYSNGKIKRII